MARNYKTGLIITGDASGGIKAMRATDKELGQLNKGFERGSRRAKDFANDSKGVSRELDFLKSSAMGVGAALAGAFAVSNLRGQAQLIAETDALAKSIGVATSELQAWNYAGQQVGLGAGKMGDIFKDVSDKLGDFVATGGGEAADLFENLNLNIAELQRLSPDKQLLKIGEAISQIEDPSQRVFYLESIANDASRLLPLLEDNAAGLREFTREAESLGVAMDQVDIDNTVAANQAMIQLGGTMQGLTNQVVADLGPGFATAADSLTDMIREAGGAEEILERVGNVASTLATVYLARRLGPTLLTVGAQGLVAGRNIAAGLAIATGATGPLNRALVITQGRIAATAAAGRAMSASLALIGGPAGAAIIAGGALYYFREELGLVEESGYNTERALRANEAAIKDGSQAALNSSYEGLTLELEAVSLRAQEAMTRMLELNRMQEFYADSHLGMADAVSQQAKEQETLLADLWDHMIDLQAAQERNRRAREALTDAEEDGIETGDRLTKTAESAAKAAKEQADSLESLRKQLDPAYASSQRLAQSTALLDRGLMTGALTLEQYLDLWDRAADVYIDAGRGAEDAADTIDTETDAMATLWERRLERMDDAGVDMWRSFLDSSEDALGSFKRLAISTLAEVAHNYTTRPLMASFGLSADGGRGGQSGGGFGGSGDMLSTGKNLWSSAQSGFGNIAWSGASNTPYASGFANSATSGIGQSGLWGGSTANFGGMTGLASAGAGFAGGWAGSEVGGMVSDKQANSSYGQMAGTAIGTYFGGPIGAGIGSFIGSLADTLFGSGGSDLDIAMQRLPSSTAGDAARWDHGIVANGGLGAVGFHEANSREVKDLWDVDEAQKVVDTIAQMDSLIAGMAQNAGELGEMQRIAQGYYGETSNPGDVVDRLTSRYEEVFEALGGDFGDFVRGLEGGIEEVVEQATLARNALSLMSASAERLNLNIDTTGVAAYEASSQLAQLAGGVDNLASLQSRYFDAFFTEEQKLANLTQDLAAEFDALGLALPDNRAGVRELVSGIDQMTEAGREQYATILNLVPSLREYTMAMEEQAGVASALAQADQSAFRDIYETYTDAISASEQLAAERKRQLQDEMRAVDQLGQLIDSLLLSNQSILDPMERLQEAQRQFALLQVRAESGDTQAAGQLRGASTQYLDAAASYYGQSSAQYAEIFGDVTDGVEDLERQFGMSVDALGSIESIERRALREQQRAREVLESSLAAQLSQTESLSSMADLLISLPDQLASAIAAALPKADLGGGAGGSAGGGGSPSLAGAINDIYNDVLGRDADQTGLDYWMGDVARGHSLDDIRRSIEQNKADGSHALGLGTVPFDGYRAELHKGETVLPAPLAQMYRDNAPGRQSVDLEPLTRELHALRQEVAQLRAERRQDAAQAAGQRGEQVREQRKTSHNLKLKGRVT